MKRTDRGFALLLVFAMAASVAIVLYLELPVAAFEAQRLKEDLLVERGHEYVHAIKLYVRKTSGYPQTIEALENTNNIRYLRRRYKDPLAGKDEWRLIHAGPGGILIDSLVTKPGDPNKDKDKDKQQSANTFVSEGPAVGSGLALTQSIVRPRRRRAVPEPPASGGQEYQSPSTDPASGSAPTSPGPPVSSQTGGASPSPMSPFPGQPGDGVPNAALEMIGNLLRTPRPGGFPGLSGPGAGAQIAPGIAGVASKVDAEGIKIVNDRTNYKEWEFVYDPRKDPSRTAMGLNQPGTGVLPVPTATPAGTLPVNRLGGNLGGQTR